MDKKLKNGSFKKYLLLLVWAVGIIFPMAWLGTKNQAFGAWFNAFFQPAWMHVLMHSLLYAVLACLAAWILHRPGKSLPLAGILGICLAVALVQEGFQAVTTDPFSPAGISYDLAVDACGASLGLLAFSAARWGRINHR